MTFVANTRNERSNSSVGTPGICIRSTSSVGSSSFWISAMRSFASSGSPIIKREDIALKPTMAVLVTSSPSSVRNPYVAVLQDNKNKEKIPTGRTRSAELLTMISYHFAMVGLSPVSEMSSVAIR